MLSFSYRLFHNYDLLGEQVSHDNLDEYIILVLLKMVQFLISFLLLQIFSMSADRVRVGQGWLDKIYRVMCQREADNRLSHPITILGLRIGAAHVMIIPLETINNWQQVTNANSSWKYVKNILKWHDIRTWIVGRWRLP